jgi:hypothetical protein
MAQLSATPFSSLPAAEPPACVPGPSLESKYYLLYLLTILFQSFFFFCHLAK